MKGRLHVSGNWFLKLQVEVFQASSNVPFRNRPELTKQIRVSMSMIFDASGGASSFEVPVGAAGGQVGGCC